MRCCLKHDMSHSRFHHLRQITLNIRRFRRGHVKTSINYFAADFCIYSGNQSNFHPRSVENFINQVGSSRFSICSSDTDDGHLASRVIVERRSQVSESLAGILHPNVGYGEHHPRSRAHNGNRSFLHRIRNKLVTIRVATANGDKNIALAHPSGIILNRLDG